MLRPPHRTPASVAARAEVGAGGDGVRYGASTGPARASKRAEAHADEETPEPPCPSTLRRRRGDSSLRRTRVSCSRGAAIPSGSEEREQRRWPRSPRLGDGGQARAPTLPAERDDGEARRNPEPMKNGREPSWVRRRCRSGGATSAARTARRWSSTPARALSAASITRRERPAPAPAARFWVCDEPDADVRPDLEMVGIAQAHHACRSCRSRDCRSAPPRVGLRRG